MTLPERYQFGPFQVDPSERVCRRGNEAIALTHKAFDLLLLLLRNAGRAIPKAELMTALWPDAAVEENNLSQTVFLLRKALGDDSERAVYIQTVPRLGYKFVAEVTSADPPAASRLASQSGVPSKHAVRVAAASVALVVAGMFWWQRTQSRPLTDQDVLVLADFTNTTGDAAFDGALRQALAFDLEESPFLKIMDDEEVNQTLQLMGRPAGQRITNDVAHEVCVREAQKATIGGSIASLGKTYQIALQATNCQTGATLAREQAEAEDKEHVLRAVAMAAKGMRAKLGESLSSLQKPHRHIEATTPSLEAFRAYALGTDLKAQGKPREAIPHLQRAIELDRTFAAAYDLVAAAYGDVGDLPRSNEYLVKAFALIDHASERERLLISGRYYTRVTHELNKAIDAYEVLFRIDPRSPRPHNRLSQVYSARGEYEKALGEVLEALRLEPRSVFDVSLMDAYIKLDRIAEGKAVATRALAQRPDDPYSHLYLLTIAYIQDDHAAEEKEIQWFAGKPDHRSLQLQASNALRHGQRRKAKELYQRAAETARWQGLTDVQSGPPQAVIDALMGDCEAARREKSNLALVLCGDASALRLADEQAAKNPPSNPNTASLLYQRGLTRLREGKGAEAAAEFQKILDHKGRNWGPQYSLAHLGLARASALIGNAAKARKSYKDFLALWNDADKDLPFYIQANKEFAELQ